MIICIIMSIRNIQNSSLADKVTKKIDQLFVEKGWGKEKIKEWSKEHMRTEYTKEKMNGIMRAPNRIPTILKHLERIWKDNPDYRLGQLIVIATKPEKPCQEVFYNEDNDMLDGLLNLENRLKNTDKKNEKK